MARHRDRLVERTGITMVVAEGMMVEMRLELHDAQGALLDAPQSPVTYLHGGGALLAGLERALEGRAPGETVRVQLEPDDAFGDYDPELLRVEPVERYGEGLAIGMEVEEDDRLYLVTDLAEGRAVLDANHPLAGMALRFVCEILSVRRATEEELRQGEGQGPC